MEKYPSPHSAARSDRIRQLGFDPNHLTPSEQAELLELSVSTAYLEPSPSAPLRSDAGGQPRGGSGPRSLRF